jgi:DNA-binding NarL/FixJ family response regulator
MCCRRPRSGRRTTGRLVRGLPITAREREVAALAARGLSNRQIAEELIVAERTVHAHVGSILGRLGFRSRAQIAAWAVEQGLV